MAYFYLFHSNAHLMNYTMDNIGLIPHYIASLYPGSKIDTVNSFSQNKIKLMVSAEGIQLFSSGADNTMKPVFPKDLGLWGVAGVLKREDKYQSEYSQAQ